ncbi:MAG: tyrosine-type recombinase/integrase [Methylocella sp.]
MNRLIETRALAVQDQNIGLNDVRSLAPGQTIFDAGVRGFGARRQKGSRVSYFVIYRTKEGRQRWQTIDRHGSPWTPDMARKEARRILGEVAAGSDPACEKTAFRKAAIVAELCDLYFQDAEAGRLLTRLGASKKSSTLATDKGRIARHIKPILGALKVAAVTREDIEHFMHAVAEGKTAARTKTARKHGLARVTGGRGTASRTVGLLGAIFTYAVRKRMRADNPVHGVVRFADGKRERRLTADEYRALGAGLRAAAAAGIWPPAIGAARFLALTGWRRGEELSLRWDEVDLAGRTATLPDTKTGRSVRPLSRAACAVLKTLPRLGDLVFSPARGADRMALPGFWGKIAKQGGLPAQVTPHVLRHSFASLVGDLGYSESTIGALIGHTGNSVTSRYVHTADKVLLAAADTVSARTKKLMQAGA